MRMVRILYFFLLWTTSALVVCVGCSESQQPTHQPVQPIVDAPRNGDGGLPVVDPNTRQPSAPSLDHGSLPVVDPITLPVENTPSPVQRSFP